MALACTTLNFFSGSYAFLEFDEEDDARKAIDEMNHKDFKGQTLNVELGGQIKRAKVVRGHPRSFFNNFFRFPETRT